jgi:hypothetical protein
MKISAKKRSKIYAAIREPIVDLRIKISHELGCRNISQIDYLVSQKEAVIFDEVMKALEGERE